jgi:hypothetical protein
MTESLNEDILHYIVYKLVPKPDSPLQISGTRTMGFSYDADPVDVPGRAATTFDEILAGRRISTVRSAKYGNGWVEWATYRITSQDGREAFVYVVSNTEFDPKKLTLEQWQEIAKTERWSVDYFVGKHGSPEVKAELKAGPTSAAPETDSAVPDTGRGRVIYVKELSTVPDGEIAAWGSNMFNADKGTATPGAGQAEAAAGRTGWIGIPTKRDPGTFLTDDDLTKSDFSKLMDTQLKKVEATLASGRDVYFPSKGIGTGKANLKASSPAIWEKLNSRLKELGITNAIPGSRALPSKSFAPPKRRAGLQPDPNQDYSPIEAEATEVKSTPTTVDAVVAAGKLLGNGKVDGGTGWATEGALLRGIPVYLYDQVTDRWYTASEPQKSIGGWKTVDSPPTDVRAIAGVGSRTLTERGNQEIVAYVESLDKSVVIHSGGAGGSDTAFEETHAKRGGEVVSHSFEGHKRVSKSGGQVIHSRDELVSTRDEVNAIARSLQKSITWDKADRASWDKTEELVMRNMFQIAPGRNVGIAQRERSTFSLSSSREAAAAAKEESKLKRGFPKGDLWTIPHNVYSGNKVSQFIAALTNRTNDLPRTKEGWATSSLEKGSTKNRYPVVFQGKVYPSAEHAYLALSPEANKPDTVTPEEIDLMGRIIAEKLRQNPRLLERVQQRINAVGENATPQDWIQLLSHWTKAVGRWEGNGIESPFLQALAKGAELAIADPESGEQTRLIEFIQDPKNQVNLPKQGAVNIPPNFFGDIDVQPATGSDDYKFGASGPDRDTTEGFTAKLLGEFQGMRETAMGVSTIGSKMQYDRRSADLSNLQKTNLYRTLGASGPYGFRFDSLNQEPVPGIDPRRTVRGRINALAAKMGVSLPPELDFKPGKPIIADKKTVAQVMADAFMAIRYLNTVETAIDVRVGGEERAEMAALMLELSRTLHEIGDPYSLAMIKGISRSISSGQYTGVTSKAKEIEALGVDMTSAEQAPSLYGRPTQAKLRQLWSAQVGMVPQSSPLASEAKMFRSLDLDLLEIPVKSKRKTRAVARASDSRGIPSITQDNAIYDLQRVVDEVGIWDVSEGGGDDVAQIDLDGFVDGDTALFKRTQESPISDLLGIDEALDVIRQYTSVKKLDNRTDFTLFNYRTGFKYRSRLGPKGVIGGDPQIEAPKVERIKVDKPSAATQADSLRRRIEKIRQTIDLMDRYSAGVAIGAGGGTSEMGAVQPIKELETYRALPSGVSGKRLAFLRSQALDAVRTLTADLNKLIGSDGTDRISWFTTEFENTYEAELAPKYGEGGAYAEMFGVQASANVATERVNSRGWRGIIVAGGDVDAEGKPKPVKVTLPQWYLDKRRGEYAKWKGALGEVADIHGRAYALAYMTSEEGKALYGAEPPKFDKNFVELLPGEYILPAPVATEIASVNWGLITDVEINALGRSELDPDAPVALGVDLREEVRFKLNIRPIVSSKYLVLKNGTVVANRSSEAGFIQHRKVYPFRVERVDGGGYRVVRLEGYQYQHTDPNQIYGNKQMQETLSKLDSAFSEFGEGFNSNEMGNLLNELQTAVALDGYSALEILAINGDIFPQLEAEIIGSITEHTGSFRTNLAPSWSMARAQDMVFNASMSGAEKAAASVSPVPAERMAGPFAKIGKMQSSVDPDGMMAGAPAYRITEYPDWLVGMVNQELADDFGHANEKLAAAEQSGDQDAILAAKRELKSVQEKMIADKKITIETEQGRRRHAGSIVGQTITRDQAFALASPSNTAIQKAIGGTYTVHDILASPEKFGHSVRTETMEGDSGALYIVRALTYMLRLAEEAVVQMGYGSRFSKADMEKYGLTESVVVLADKASAIEAARIGGDTFDAIVRESLDASRLAAMALTEMAKGTLRKSWSDSLDPKYHRHEVASTVTARSSQDEYMYPLYRMLEPVTVDIETAQGVERVLANMSKPGMDMARAAGALGDKATAFYNAFYKSAGLPDPKDLAGMSLPADQAYEITARLAAEASKSIGVSLFVPTLDGTEGIYGRDAALQMYRAIAAANPKEIVTWEQGQGGFEGGEGMMQITKPDGTVEVVNEAEWRKQAKERKRNRAIDGFDASTGLDEEGMVIEFNMGDEESYGYSEEEEPMLTGDKAGKSSSLGYKFARAVAVKYASSGNIEEAVTSTLSDFDDLPRIGSTEMKLFFRNFWKTLSSEMSGRMQGPAVEQMIKTIIESQDGKVKLENARRVFIQPTDFISSREVPGGSGTTISSQAGAEVPETSPKIATIKLNDNGKLDVDPQFLLAYLRGTPNENGKYSGGIDKLTAKTDNALKQLAWEAIRKYLNGPEGVKAPFDWGVPGPATVMIRRMVDSIESGRTPTFEIDPPTDTPLNIQGYNPDKGKKQSMAGDDLVDPNDYESLQDSVSGASSDDDYSGGYRDTDTDIMNLSVKQGKLLGLLQPDQLLPKFSPGLRKIDFGLRTPKGNFGGGLGADVGIMALQGNLTPENALFSAGLNATNLLTKSPLKAGIFGAAAGLAATAATGGDLGRTMFGIVGSVLGGGLGAFASGGLGTFVGSTAGSLAADELWKGLFGSNDGMRPTIRPIQPDIPTVRLP